MLDFFLGLPIELVLLMALLPVIALVLIAFALLIRAVIAFVGGRILQILWHLGRPLWMPDRRWTLLLWWFVVSVLLVWLGGGWPFGP